MADNLPSVTGNALIKALQRDGWEVVRNAEHGAWMKKAFPDGSTRCRSWRGRRCQERQSHIAKSNGKSLMSRNLLPVTSVSNKSESESLLATAAFNSLRAKW